MGIPRPKQLQQMYDVTQAIRDRESQPEAPSHSIADQKDILLLKIANKMLDKLDREGDSEAPRQVAPSRPALPDTPQPSSSSSSARPVYPTGLSGAPSLPRPPQQQALPAPAGTMGPAVPGYYGDAPQYQPPEQLALPPIPAAGAGKPKRKRVKGIPVTKEVLNIPQPILEYFDVKNDPHFIRAPKHQPKK